MTQIPARRGWLYLAVILNLYSHRRLGKWPSDSIRNGFLISMSRVGMPYTTPSSRASSVH